VEKPHYHGHRHRLTSLATKAWRRGQLTRSRPGKYTTMVKVIDIFGNDTSQALEVEVR
jgi:hypothetical protein